jgi:PAS domain S-box-containing protein
VHPVPAKTKILLIDDNASDRELIARMLSPQATVLQATNVNEGLRIYRGERPDCVLLDHYMPGIAGIDALATFVSEQAVVIMITGAHDDRLGAEAFKRGARDYISKRSLTEAVLWRMINRELERRRLELELHESRERFDEIASRIPEVLWVRTLGGDFLYLSPSFEQIWARSRAGMTREIWNGALHPDDRGDSESAERSWSTGQEYELVFRIVRPDGQVRTISSRGYPIYENGALARIGGIARDVTEENRMSLQLRLAQKLEAIGQLAAGVAHEINTPAQYVSDNITFLMEGFREILPLLDACSDLVKKGTADGDLDAICELAKAADLDYLVKEVPGAIQQSGAGIAQIKKIVQAMKEFSHPSDEMQMVNLNRSIESTVTVAKNEWKYVSDVKLELADNLPPVACHPSEINQVILNLVVNAAHAIGDVVKAEKGAKGLITIATRADGADVVVTIEDTGGGIPQGIRDKVFDPFFTTKEVGKGTGQGLAIAHRIIVEHHEGSIRFETEVGKGTRFVIRLPIQGAKKKEPDEDAGSVAA